MLGSLGFVLAEIGWNPEIRNILSVSVGVVVLVGSVYLIVGSNTGLRSGALITLAALLGWMTTMGVIWWIYGIGLTGRHASWHVEELNYSTDGYAGLVDAENEAARHLAALDELPTAAEILAADPTLVDRILPPIDDPEIKAARAANITLGQILEVEPAYLLPFFSDQLADAIPDDAPEAARDLVESLAGDVSLGGWRILAQSDGARGDAAATSDAFLGPDARGLFATSSDYLVRDVFVIGGRVPDPDANIWEQAWNKVRHTVNPRIPVQHAVVQVQAVVPVCAEGQAPAEHVCHAPADPNDPPLVPELSERAPIVSVIMVRDLGILRLPAVLTTLICGALFALTCWTLHRRDKVIAAVRAA